MTNPNVFNYTDHKASVALKAEVLGLRHEEDVLILNAYNGNYEDCVSYLVVNHHCFPDVDDNVILDEFRGTVRQYDSTIDFKKRTTEIYVYFDYIDFCRLKEMHTTRIVEMVC